MIAILVISPDLGFLEAMQSQLRDDARKISCHASLQEAKALLRSGVFDFCILDLPRVDNLADLAACKIGASHCEIIAVGDDLPEAEIERARRHGVDLFVPRALQGSLLNRLIHASSPAIGTMSIPPPYRPEFRSPLPRGRSALPTETLRDFSHILSHSLDLDSLVHHFVLKVREIVGVNRIAVFLEEPKAATPSGLRKGDARLQCVCAVGIPADLQNCVDLSRRSGIGHWVTRTGQILRAGHAQNHLPAAEAARVQHEFELLGCEVAIPINDRERSLGVALLGGHLTRITFSDDELQLMFHLMEELGLSVKNSWLHTELRANHQLFENVLSSMRSGSMVVGPELEVVHANEAMIRFITAGREARPSLSFADLPPPIASRVHEAVEQGKEVSPFQFTDTLNGGIFRVSIIPFQNQAGRLPQSAMVVMEDFTEIERAKEAAVETARLKLTSLIAKRFAHEIRNSLVPLTTHLQLLDDQYDQPGFRDSLKSALSQETGRIERFTEQMLFLAEPKFSASALITLEKLLRESFDEAQSYSQRKGVLTIHNPGNGSPVRCQPQALRHAFKEIFINSLQSSPEPAEVQVEVLPSGQNGDRTVTVSFRDSGKGFGDETARRAAEPFYTTRNTGVGLGLTVARKVAQDLGGDLQVIPRSSAAGAADVLLSLPCNHHHE